MGILAKPIRMLCHLMWTDFMGFIDSDPAVWVPFDNLRFECMCVGVCTC